MKRSIYALVAKNKETGKYIAWSADGPLCGTEVSSLDEAYIEVYDYEPRGLLDDVVYNGGWHNKGYEIISVSIEFNTEDVTELS